MKIPKHVLEILSGGKKVGGSVVSSVGKNAKGVAKFGIGYAAFEGVSKLLTQANDNATNDNNDGRLRSANDDAPEKLRVGNDNSINKIAPFRVVKNLSHKIPGVNDNNISSSTLNRPSVSLSGNDNNISSLSLNRPSLKLPDNDIAPLFNSLEGLTKYTEAIPSNENLAALKIVPMRKAANSNTAPRRKRNNLDFLANILPYLKKHIEQNNEKIKKIAASIVMLEGRVDQVIVLEKRNADELKNIRETVRVEKVIDDKRVNAMASVIQSLSARIDGMKKEADERAQAEEYRRKEDAMEGKDDKPYKDSKGRFTGIAKNRYVRDSLAPLALAMLMGMGALKQMTEGLQEQFSELQTNYGDLALKLAAVGVPAFAIGKFLNDKFKSMKTPPTLPNTPKGTVKATDPATNKSKDVMKRMLDLESKLTKLKAPSWVFDILKGVRKLATKATSKLPLIGIIVSVVLELLEDYDPNVHSNPKEFQKLIITSIVKAGADALVFTAIVGIFFLFGGPLGALAGVLVYMFASEQLTEAIQTELIGYLVKYVFFDEDPIEAAKKTGRYLQYEQAKAKADKDIADAEANIRTIEAKELRGDKLTPEDISKKQGYQAQIEGKKKFKDKLTNAQKLAVDVATEEKEKLDIAKAEYAERRKPTPGGAQAAQVNPQPGGLPIGLDALKNEIAKGEGDYKAFNKGRAGDSVNSKEYDLENMTVAEVLAAQDAKKLFAVGKYQFIPNTLKEAVAHTGVDPNAKFNGETQEKLFPYLISDKKRPNLAAYLAGRSDNANAALNDLAYEFASIPDASGRGKYDGDSAGNAAAGGQRRAQKVLDILAETRGINIQKKQEDKFKAQIPVPSENTDIPKFAEETQGKPLEIDITKPNVIPIPSVKDVDIPEPRSAPPTPPVTVINQVPNPGPTHQYSSQEASDRPSPGEVPTPTAGNRPRLNMEYSAY